VLQLIKVEPPRLLFRRVPLASFYNENWALLVKFPTLINSFMALSSHAKLPCLDLLFLNFGDSFFENSSDDIGM